MDEMMITWLTKMLSIPFNVYIYEKIACLDLGSEPTEFLILFCTFLKGGDKMQKRFYNKIKTI
jgi:hypothetical protein